METKGHKRVSSNTFLNTSSNLKGLSDSPYNPKGRASSSMKTLNAIFNIKSGIKKIPLQNQPHQARKSLLVKLGSEINKEDSMLINKTSGNFYLVLLKKKLKKPEESWAKDLEKLLGVFDEVIAYLKPFSEVLKSIKAELEKYLAKSDEFNELRQDLLTVKDASNQCSKTIESLNKDKVLLVKKLDKSATELERYMKENTELRSRLLEYETDFQRHPDRFLNQKIIMKNMIHQCETIHAQSLAISELKVSESKLKNTINNLHLTESGFTQVVHKAKDLINSKVNESI